MTWNGTDSARLADDQACIPVGIQVQNDLADSATVRTGQVSRAWLDVSNYRVPFSTPSDNWRTIPFVIPKQGYTDSVSVRIRYLLDAAATSGITAPTDAGDIRVRINGVNSTASTVTVTGLTTAEATITVDTTHVADASLLVGELQFRSKRGSAEATWNIVQVERFNHFIASAAPSPTPTTASAPHYEFDLDVLGIYPPIAHVCQCEAGSDGTFLARVWPFVDEGDEMPWGDGKTQITQAYNLPAWTILSASIEWTASANLVPAIPTAALQAGVGTSSVPVNTLVDTMARLIQRRPNVYAIGPAMGEGTQDYLTGMLTGAATKTTIGGAYIDRPSEEFGLTVIALMCPRWSSFANTEMTLTLDMDQRSGGSASDSETVDFLIASGNEARTRADGGGTLHQFNVGNTTRSRWSPADTGAEGDCDRLQMVTAQIDYTGDAGDMHELTVSLTGADVWVGAVTAWGRVSV